jgi:hypothetical protein
MIEPSEQIELDPVSEDVQVGEDRRPKIEQPPPVRLVAIDDCMLWAPAGLERQLDEFYVELLKFEREEIAAGTVGHELIYRAENFRVRIQILERPATREDFRPLALVVESLNELAGRLIEAEIEHLRERGIVPGHDNLLLSDPAGNPVIIGEFRMAI